MTGKATPYYYDEIRFQLFDYSSVGLVRISEHGISRAYTRLCPNNYLNIIVESYLVPKAWSGLIIKLLVN